MALRRVESRPNAAARLGRAVWRTLYWTYERTTWQYDLMVIAILAFVWLTPPDWLGDPMAEGCGAEGCGVVGWLLELFR